MEDYSWYENIEEPIREIVKRLRDNGINTTCSCGHLMYIQGEVYEGQRDLDKIYAIMCDLKIKTYQLNIIDRVINGHRYPYFELMLPDENGLYHEKSIENTDYKGNKLKKLKTTNRTRNNINKLIKNK